MTGATDPTDGRDELDPFESMLTDAQNGDSEAVGKILEQCRDYLLLIANQDLDKKLQRKIGASDLVQESMMTAQAHFDQFDGSTREQFLAWLRGILNNDVRHWRRHYKGAQKRSVQRETEFTGSQQIPPEPSDRLHTPSTQAAADEEEAMLSRAMQALPENYQLAIRLRNWDDKSFSEIGEQLNCTAEAARKLWSRAILKLQEVLANDWPDLNPDLLEKDEH